MENQYCCYTSYTVKILNTGTDRSAQTVQTAEESGSLLFAIPSATFVSTENPNYSVFRTIHCLTLLHSERPKLFGVLAVLHAIGLKS